MGKKRKRSFLSRLLYILFIGFIGLAGFVGFNFIYPDVSALKKENHKKTAFMKFRESEWEKQGKKYKITQKWVPLSAVSPFLIKAVLIGEEDKFWKHEGFDYEAMQKAVEKDIKEKKF